MANKPNNPSLWSRAKSLAKQKFDVYPSAYANGWAAKWYKSKGGTWRKAEYGMEVMENGGTNNPGFEALPEYVQAKILSNMAAGGERMPPEIARARFAAAGNLDQMDDYGYAYGGYIPEMMGYGGAAQQAAIAIAMKKAGKKPKSMKDGGEPNGEMALGQMAAVQDKMKKLLQFVKPNDNLDPWIASKLAVMDHSADAITDYMMYGPEADEMEMEQMAKGGYTVSRSNDRKGKTHKVTGPDGTVKYFGDSKLGQHPKDPERKAAFYARHKKNLAGNPYFRAFARATWADGGEISYMENGGYIGQDGKRHFSKTPTWSGNAGYEEGGELPMADTGMFWPGLFNNLSQMIPQSLALTDMWKLKQPSTATYNESTGMFSSPSGQITKQDTRSLGFTDSGLYIKDEAKKLQDTLSTGSAKDIRQGVRGFNENFGTNLKAPGFVIGKKGRDAMQTMGALSGIGKMGIGMASAATDLFINNPKIKKDNMQRQVLSGMTDSLYMPAGEDRGDYVAAGSRLGEFRPDQYVANKGMYTGQFYPSMNIMETGGIIDEELDMPLGLLDLPMMSGLPEENKPAAPAAASPSRSSGANPLAETTWNDVSAEFQGVKHLGIWGDKRHQKTKSDHNSGDALDIGIINPDQGNQIAQKMIKEAADRNVKYVIWNKQIWNPSVSNEWRPYKGDNPHTSHVHVSFNRNANNSEDLGQISLTHNNPLNIHQGDFASKYGGVQGSKDGGGFVSKFPDMKTGIQAAKDLLFGPNYNNLTIEQARNKWVKGNPGTPSESSSHIVKAMGGNKKISELTNSEKDALIKQFAKWEGKQAYTKIKDMPLFADGGTYDEGGVYDLTEEEIRSILSLGGNVEFI